MTESRRAAVRIVANYTRLVAGVLLGLLLMRLQLHALGGEVVGLISLVASTIGLATVVEETVENSMVRELGAAHHSGDERAFRRVYNSALAVSAWAAGAVALVYGVILLILPLLEIDPALLFAARCFIMAKMVESAVIVALSPAYNMYLATERMLGFNGWLLARRASFVAAAMTTLWTGLDSPSDSLILYGCLSASMHALVVCAAVGAIVWRDRRLLPRRTAIDRGAMRSIARTSAANATMFAAGLLELPAGALIMNLAFGLQGNLIFGLGTQMAAYVRMVAAGPIGGIEAVSARFAASVDPAHRLRTLAYHSTRLQTFVVIPTALAMLVLAPDLMRLWIGGTGVDQSTIADAALLTRIMVLGFFGKCMLDVWWRMLYGAGYVREYVRLVVTGAMITPLLALGLLTTLPHAIRFCAPAMAYSIMHATMFLGALPAVVARCFQLPYARLLSAVFRPVIPAGIAALVMMLVRHRTDATSALSIVVALACFGAAYVPIAWLTVLERDDRARVKAALRRLRSWGASPPPGDVDQSM